MTAEKKKIEGWTAKRVLEAYGLRRLGRSLSVPTRETQGCHKVMDEETQAGLRLASVPGFWQAKPAIDWVHSEGMPIEKFNPNRRDVFNIRVLWGVGEDFNLRIAAKGHYDRFYDELVRSLRENPFVPVLFDKNDDAA